MRLTHIDINFDIKYEGHQNWSKTLCMYILRVFGDLQFDIKIDVYMCEPHYVNSFFL